MNYRVLVVRFTQAPFSYGSAAYGVVAVNSSCGLRQNSHQYAISREP
jgi:hypothetical protein